MSKKEHKTFESDALPTPTSGVPVLQVEDLNVRFPSEDGVVHAVRGVNLTVHAGEILGVVGESGSGKTTVGTSLLGYTRAGRLIDMLERRGSQLDAVLEFRVSEEVLLERLKARGRADDTDEIILNRMKVYRDETAPLIEYYTDELKTVDAVGEVDEVFARALQALGK